MFSKRAMLNELHAVNAPRRSAIVWPMIPAKRAAARRRISGMR
jgi:hypothetical protein